MAKIKDFAKDLGLDLKDAFELIERSGVKIKSNATTIEDSDISTVLNALTKERATKNINKYLDGELVIPSEKAKKQPAKKEEKQQTVGGGVLDAPKKEEKQSAVSSQQPAKKEEKQQTVGGIVLDAPKKEEKQPAVSSQQPAKKEEKQQTAGDSVLDAPKKEEKPQFEKKPFNKDEKPQFEKKPVNKDEKPQLEKKPFNKDGFNGDKKQFNKDEKPQFEKKQFNKDGFNGDKKPFNKDEKPQFEKKPFNKDGFKNDKGGFNKGGFFDKEEREPKYNVTPKQKKPPQEDNGVREIKTKTGATRVVDTRTSHVDLSKYDDKLDHLTSDYDGFSGSNKQKLKKQNNKDSFNSKKDKERQALEKKKREAFEKAKKTQLSITVPDEITVGELASRLKVTSAEVIKRLFMMGVMATVNEVVDFDTAYLIADELGAKATKEVVVTIEEKLFEEEEDAPEALQERAP
ncbi:MAG: translation initiation factor IF-2 N-terminal domain-containing protein, partial [Clostridia bacterium]|nr:translation initiation factor IF-2 N-terminal domain-containing protein [Clostridia bacterium]